MVIPRGLARTKNEGEMLIGHTLERGGEMPVPNTNKEKQKLIPIEELDDIVNILDMKGCPRFYGLMECPKRCDPGAESCWWDYLERRVVRSKDESIQK